MDKQRKSNLVYVYGAGAKDVPKKRRHFKLKILNLVLVCAVVYFVFVMASQEFKMREIQSETEAANSEYAQLIQEEALINEKIKEASGTDMVENKAKSVLGWVGKDEFKVVEQKQQ